MSGTETGMYVRVDRVVLEPMQTVGIGYGEFIDGVGKVEFGGDHRMMREIAEAVEAAWGEVLDMPIAIIEPWQVRRVIGLDESFDDM